MPWRFKRKRLPTRQRLRRLATMLVQRCVIRGNWRRPWNNAVAPWNNAVAPWRLKRKRLPNKLASRPWPRRSNDAVGPGHSMPIRQGGGSGAVLQISILQCHAGVAVSEVASIGQWTKKGKRALAFASRQQIPEFDWSGVSGQSCSLLTSRLRNFNL